MRPGSVRIDSSSPAALANVAFQAPTNMVVLVVASPGSTAQTFNVAYGGKFFEAELDGGAVGTFVW